MTRTKGARRHLFQLERRHLRKLQVLLLLMSSLLGALILLLSQEYSIGVTDIGMVLLVAGLVSLAMLYAPDKLVKAKPPSSIRHKIVWSAVFLLIAASVVCSRTTGYQRPLSYFLLASFIGALIGLGLVSSSLGRGHRLVPLLAIAFFSLSIWAVIFFNFPTLIGADVWAHSDFASFIQSYGSVPPKEVYSLVQYTDFPMMHILFVIISDTIGASMKVSIFISSAFAGLITMLFVYLLGKELVGERAGLVAMFLLGISDMFLVNNVTLVMPQAIVIAWYAGVVYLVLRRSISPALMVVIILLLLSMIPTHQVSLFITMVTLAAILVGKVLYELVVPSRPRRRSSRRRSILRAPHINVQLMVLFVVATFSFWATSTSRGSDGQSFLGIMVDVVMRAFARGLFSGSPSNNAFATTLGGYSMIESAMYHMGFLILLLLAICGFVLFFGREMFEVRKFAVFCALFVLALIAYGSPLTGLRDAVLPERWVPFMYVLLAIVAGAAFLAILNKFKWRGVRMGLTAAVAFLFVFCMITTPYVSADNPLFEKERVARSAFTYSEVSAAKFFAETYNGSLYTDQVFGGRVFSYQVPQPNQVTVVTFNDVPLDTMFQDKSNGSVVLLRLSLLDEPTIISKSNAFGSSQLGVVGGEVVAGAVSSNASVIYSSDYCVAYM